MTEKCKPSDTPEMSTGELPEQSEKETDVPHWKSPPPPPPEHKIHERQYIPPVSEGEEVTDDTPSPPVEID